MERLPSMKMPLMGEAALLQEVNKLNDKAIRDVESLVCNANLSALAQKYEANLQKRNADIGFNLFELISDHYYRETFHSDILHALLDPHGKHKEERKYLNLFLEFMRSLGVAITMADYAHADVEKEKGRVDILIFDERFKKAIIIENKINGAGDMPRQLPRYLEYVKARDYTCDAIIYLRLNGDARPDTTDWSDDERTQIAILLKVVCAYEDEDSEIDLVNGWIRKCEVNSTNPDALHILRQYGALIRKLGGNAMNKPIMQKFFEIVIKDENLKAALSVKAMVDDLILYRVERIMGIFKSDLSPFHKVSNYLNYDAYFTGLMWNEAHLGLDIVVETESYLFAFWDRNDDGGPQNQAKAMLKRMGCQNDYTFRDSRLIKEFAFPSQEEELIEHIREFKRKLGQAVETK